jgi:hypothetical protein
MPTAWWRFTANSYNGIEHQETMTEHGPIYTREIGYLAVAQHQCVLVVEGPPTHGHGGNTWEWYVFAMAEGGESGWIPDHFFPLASVGWIPHRHPDLASALTSPLGPVEIMQQQQGILYLGADDAARTWPPPPPPQPLPTARQQNLVVTVAVPEVEFAVDVAVAPDLAVEIAVAEAAAPSGEASGSSSSWAAGAAAWIAVAEAAAPSGEASGSSSSSAAVPATILASIPEVAEEPPRLRDGWTDYFDC